MEIIKRQTIASVEVSDIRATEDELALLEAALHLALQMLGTDELERHFGAARDEIEALRDDLRAGLAHGTENERKPVLA